ncbi:MAG: histidine kinase [Bacteroidales bacterium]|nr:histidine kinase [Bacteroidales bacterium]
MKSKKTSRLSWAEIILSPYLMAMVLAIIIILILPDIFNRYEARLVSSGRSDKANSYEVYHDLDNNGYSERIVAYMNSLAEPAIKLLSNKGKSIEQWNFIGRFPERAGFLSCGDTDADSISEIYLFTIRRDSLFLHAINPFGNKRVIFKNKLVTTIDWRNDTIQGFVNEATFYDLDDDGYKEMIFPVKAGFSLQPRGIFVYDRQQDTIYHSEMLGANIGQIHIRELQPENGPAIFVACNTLGNIADSLNIPYNDYSSWFMGFDRNLNFLFPPIPYHVYPSSASFAFTEFAGKQALAVFFQNRSEKDDPSLILILILDPQGNILLKRTFSKDLQETNGWHSIHNVVLDDNRETLALSGMDVITLLNDSLRPSSNVSIMSGGHIRMKTDLNGDGKREMIFSERDNKILIFQAGLRYPVYVDTPRDPFSEIFFSMSVKYKGEDVPELFIKADNRIYFYTFSSNPLYYLQYPIWLGIYLFLLLIILLIRQAMKLQLERKMEVENRLNALQLKTLKSQMDPHFMLNALNSISDNILNKEHDIAYRYLTKYSNLLRMLFTRADKLSVSLQEEFSFVKQYLELEHFRYSDKFTFSIDTGPGTNQDTPLPRMLIQLFVENAIKHGIMNRQGRGHIRISTEQLSDSLLITIEDDGIGRQAAEKLVNGHGKGLKIVDEMISLFEKIQGVKISYSISDLDKTTTPPEGTRVLIEIPC